MKLRRNCVGIYTRDYYRQAHFGDSIPPTCKNLIIANVVVFLLQIFITRPTTQDDIHTMIERDKSVTQHHSARRDKKSIAKKEAPQSESEKSKPVEAKPKPDAKEKKNSTDEAKKTQEDDVDDDEYNQYEDILRAGVPTMSIVQEWFELDSNKVVHQGQIWRLITCAFCHDRFSIWHILFNMLFLFWFGKMLEMLYGSREFLLFYLAAAVVSSLCYVGLNLFTHSSVPAIGASGAVMAVVVLYAIHHPYEKIRIYWFFPIEIRWLVAIYIIFDLHPVLLALAGTPMPTGVANAAHLGGAAFGYLYWRYRLRLEDTWDRVTRQCRIWQAQLQGNARIYRALHREESPEEDLDSLVDTILQKLHKEGPSSLSDLERETLRVAADRLRRRPRARRSH